MPPFASQSFRDPSFPGVHRGIVSVTGSKEVDLGIGHNNFTPSVSLKADTAGEANAAASVTWEFVSGRPGVFKIFAWKATAAGTTTLIAATAASDVSFIAFAGASVVGG